jgi:hypothetical protein
MVINFRGHEINRGTLKTRTPTLIIIKNLVMARGIVRD